MQYIAKGDKKEARALTDPQANFKSMRIIFLTTILRIFCDPRRVYIVAFFSDGPGLLLKIAAIHEDNAVFVVFLHSCYFPEEKKKHSSKFREPKIKCS